MKNQVILLCLISNFVFAQNSVTTYYDFHKTLKKEVYQVDANGERNGISKYYDEKGALIMEGVFKFGKQYGLCLKYTKFPNYSGQMQVLSKETFSNGVLDGPYIHYSYNENLGIYEDLKGNYKAGKADGLWTEVIPLEQCENQDEYDLIKLLPIFKGSMAVKRSGFNNRGLIVAPPDGKYEIYYYPSNKIYCSRNFINGKNVGEKIFFYPDGKIWGKTIYSETNEVVSSERYYYDGKLNFKEVANPYSYKGYNPDGSPNNIMLEVIERKKREEIDRIEKAKQDSIKQIENEERQKFEEQRKIIENFHKIITSKQEEFKKLYVSKTEYIGRDENGYDAYKNTYIKGQYVYEKGDKVLQENIKLFYDLRGFNLKQENCEKLISLGNDIIKLLDKLISLASSETKQLDKELKKAETNEDIKRILGL